MENNEIHVIFGTGPLGATLAESLLADGKHVRLVSRKGSNPIGFHPALEVVSADVTVEANGRKVAEGADVVYNCMNAPYDKWLEQLRPIYKGVLDAAESAGAALVAADNLYGYGPTTGPMKESTPLAAKTPKCRLRAELVEEMLQAHQDGRVEVAIVQGSDFFGPRAINAHMGLRAFTPILKGKSPYLVGDIDQPHAFTYVPDFVRALKIVGERWEGFGRTWIVPSGPALTPREFVARAAQLAGTAATARAIAQPLFYATGWFMPMMRELRETLYQFEQPFTVDSSDFERTFAFEPTPLDEALRVTLAWTAQQLRPATSRPVLA